MKGPLVSSNSPKKRTNKFVFTTMTNSFVRFMGEFEDIKKSLRNYLTFNGIFAQFFCCFLQQTGFNMGKIRKNRWPNPCNSFITIFNHYRWKGIAVVGGDGTFYEVLNGIFARPDWQDVFKQVPLSVIPSGSGNGLVR